MTDELDRPRPELACQCQGENGICAKSPCKARATQEDMLCDGCREMDGVAARRRELGLAAARRLEEVAAARTAARLELCQKRRDA